MPDNPMDSSPAETFSASRWTSGNFFFPTRLVISPQRVSRVKSRVFGSNEESIAMSKIASVHISTGVFWAEIASSPPAAQIQSPATDTASPTPNAFAI